MFTFTIIDGLSNRTVYTCSIVKSRKVRTRAEAVDAGYGLARLSNIHPDRHCYHQLKET